jgi:hypothetical protein
MIYRFLIFFLAIIVFGLAACKNNDEVFPVVIPTNLNVVNASGDTLNYYLNGTRQNNSSSLYPGGQSTYIVEPAGLQSYQFKNLGGFSVLFSVPLTLQGSTQTNIYYSLYVGGPSANDAFVTMDQLFTDTVTNSTQIKFVNASPSTGNLDFYVGDTVKYQSLAFKGATSFYATGSGLKQVMIYKTGTSAPIVDTAITFEPGSIYTVFSQGIINGKGTAAFSIGTVVNSSAAY